MIIFLHIINSAWDCMGYDITSYFIIFAGSSVLFALVANEVIL